MSTTPNEAKRHPLIAVAIATLLALTLISTVAWANWNWIVVQFAPKKQAAITRSEAALKADELFWQTFHNGEYEKIANTLEALIGTYVQTPNDAVTAAHIAWLHNWRISERARMESVPVTITDDMMLARRYFEEAVKLDPSEARYLGFSPATFWLKATFTKTNSLLAGAISCCSTRSRRGRSSTYSRAATL